MKKAIFEQGYFDKFSQVRLDESRGQISKTIIYGLKKTAVFISHKHSELDDLKGLLGYLQQTYGVIVYIDSQDPVMPKKTSGETANTIKERIRQCDKFILLATNGAIESKWCNWELGYGDAEKYPTNIALFQMKPKGTSDSAYVGSEYMDIYPYITYCDGTERGKDGKLLSPGYYVQRHDKDVNSLIPLAEWFKV